MKAKNLLPNSGVCRFKNTNTSRNEIKQINTFNKNQLLGIDTGTNHIHILVL